MNLKNGRDMGEMTTYPSRAQMPCICGFQTKTGEREGFFVETSKEMRIARTLNALSKYVKYNPNSPNSR